MTANFKDTDSLLVDRDQANYKATYADLKASLERDGLDPGPGPDPGPGDVVISKPSVLAPPNNAGIGGDVTYTPRTSAAQVADNREGGWTLSTTDNTLNWGSVATDGNGTYVAAWQGDADTMRSTDNGKTWTSIPSNGNYVVGPTMAYGNSTFVNAGNPTALTTTEHNVSSSSDGGASWSRFLIKDSGTAINFIDVCFDGTKFVALCNKVGENYYIFSSPDGATWTSEPLLSTSLKAGSNAWQSIGSDGAGSLVLGGKKDGVTAETPFKAMAYKTSAPVQFSLSDSTQLGNSTFKQIVYGNGKFFAYNKWSQIHNCLVSTDNGVTWTTYDVPAPPVGVGLADNYRFVMYNPFDQRFYLYREYDFISTADGITWSQLQKLDPQVRTTCGVAGSTEAVLVANQGPGVVSPNGQNSSSSALTLADSKTYDNADGADVLQPISETFTAGQTVTASSTTVFADEPAFSTAIYAGNGIRRSINTGIDLLGSGGLVWMKARTGSANEHILCDSERSNGLSQGLITNTASKGVNAAGTFISLNSDGHDLVTQTYINDTGVNYVNWTFRKAPTFFDIQTYTGNGVAGHQIPHQLTTAPGMMIIKNTSETGVWLVYHKELGATKYMALNQTDAEFTGSVAWNNTEPTENVFTLGTSGAANNSGNEYVAYLFADTPGLIKCGSYTGKGASGQSVPCGLLPEWVLVKNRSKAADWIVCDLARGNEAVLKPNLADAEGSAELFLVGDGFYVEPNSGAETNDLNDEYIFIAIAKDAAAPPSAATGTVASAIDNILTLTDVGGTWSAGDFAVSDTEVTKTGPGADVLEFVGSTPQDEPADSVTTWASATWQVSTDQNFTSPMIGTKLITNSDISQTLDEDERGAIVLADDTQYWARVRYAATSPNVASSYSAAVTFKTSPTTYSAAADLTPTTFFDPEAFTALTEHQVERRFGIDPNKVNTNKLPVNRLTNEPKGVTATFVQEGDKYRPIEDQTGTVNRLNAEVNAAQQKVEDLETRLLSRIKALENGTQTTDQPT
jgi:hypothetical protein